MQILPIFALVSTALAVTLIWNTQLSWFNDSLPSNSTVQPSTSDSATSTSNILQPANGHLLIDLNESNFSQIQDSVAVESIAPKPTDITQPATVVSVQLGDGISIKGKTLYINGNRMGPFSSLPLLSSIGPIEIIEISSFEFYPESIGTLTAIVSLPEVRLKKLFLGWCTFSYGSSLAELFSNVNFDFLKEFHLICSNLKQNEIETILSKLPSTITYLNLNFNNLHIQEKKEFTNLDNLKNLEKLILNSCKLNLHEGTSFLDFAFNCKSLKHLDVNFNPLILSYLFIKLDNWNLIELSTSQSELKAGDELKIENLSSQTELEYLDISGIVLELDHSQKLLDSMDSMIKLKFVNFKITKFPFHLIDDLLFKFPSISIECDEMDATKLIESGEHFIKNLIHLKMDHLRNNFNLTLPHMFHLEFGKIENTNGWQSMKRIITLCPNLKTLSITELQLGRDGNEDFNTGWLLNCQYSSVLMITISELVYENEKQLGLFMKSTFITFPNLEELIIEIKSKTKGEGDWIKEVTNSIKQDNTTLKLKGISITAEFDENNLKNLFGFLELTKIKWMTLELNSVPKSLGNAPQLQLLPNIETLDLFRNSIRLTIFLLKSFPNLGQFYVSIDSIDDCKLLCDNLNLLPKLKFLTVESDEKIEKILIAKLITLEYIRQLIIYSTDGLKKKIISMSRIKIKKQKKNHNSIRLPISTNEIEDRLKKNCSIM